jgi:membrane protease YdiL (CAAX protease family)
MTPAIKIGSDSHLMPVAWGITVALAVGHDLTATRALSLLQWAVFAALLCPALIPFLWQAARPLRTYAGMLVLLTLLAVFFWNALPTWMSQQPWFPNPSGYAAAFIMQAPKLVAALVMMAVLALLGYGRQEFFMSSGAHGKLWIGIGVVAALAMGLTMVVYLQTTTAGANGGAGAIRYLPLALVLAAMNSFAEEMLYRGVLFGPLLRQVTANQAISMTAVLFGIAHYHGTPSGFPGMGLTFIAGWIFGLAMVETRSILLPWFLHFVPDAVIYVTSALHN